MMTNKQINSKIKTFRAAFWPTFDHQSWSNKISSVKFEMRMSHLGEIDDVEIPSLQTFQKVNHERETNSSH